MGKVVKFPSGVEDYRNDLESMVDYAKENLSEFFIVGKDLEGFDMFLNFMDDPKDLIWLLRKVEAMIMSAEFIYEE